MLSFHCESCELDFESEPDGTGYEQAACPSCRELAITREFLAMERGSNLRMLLIALFIAALVVACCLPIWHRHGGLGGSWHGHPIWNFGHIH